MNFHDFSHDVVPVLQFCATIIGLSSLFLIWWQAKRTTRWNQVQSHHQFFKDTPTPAGERKAHDAAKKIEVNLQNPLDAEAVRKIDGDDDTRFAVRDLLNEFEELCSAVEVGTVSEDYAYAVDSGRVIKTYNIYKTFIEFYREKHENSEIWIHIQKVALRWEARKLEFHEKERKAVVRLQRQLAKLEARVQKERNAIRQQGGPKPIK